MPAIKDMFRDSPFEPLRYHMDAVRKCVALVREMFEAVRDGRYDDLDKLVNKVFEAEHEADIIKDEIRQTIPKRFFLPVYRGDLLAYLKLQDDMADSAEDVGVLLTLKPLVLLEALVDPTFEYLAKVEEVCNKTYAISDYIPKLLKGEMVGREAEHVLRLITEVEECEGKADRLQYKVSKKLFALEDQMKPTDTILWSKIFGELGQLANYAEKTGDRLRRMLAT